MPKTPITQSEILLIDCECIKLLLSVYSGVTFAEQFVNLKMWFWKKHCKGLIFSTIHGLDFFDNVEKCMAGAVWDETGEYGNNFRKFISYYKSN